MVRALNAARPAQACAVGTQAIAARYAVQPPGVLCPPVHASAQLRHWLAQGTGQRQPPGRLPAPAQHITRTPCAAHAAGWLPRHRQRAAVGLIWASCGPAESFDDFKQGFDSVPRDRLWAHLEEAGVSAGWLAAARALYANVPMTVAGGSCIIHTTIGVKQGCPLSP